VSLLTTLFNMKKQTQSLEENTAKAAFTGKAARAEAGEEVMDFEETSNLDNEVSEDIEYEVVEREILPAKIICPDCGGITLEGLEFCDKCGGEL
jgi:hypothetical protein